METIDLGGARIETRIAGAGPPLLYLHAEQFAASTGPFIDALARRHRVIAPQHPGFGPAPIPEGIRTVDDLAYLYLDLMDRLALGGVTLVGASLGGWIGLEMAVRNTARIARLALVASVGVKLSGREERDFADIFYLPDVEAMAHVFADPKRWAPDYTKLDRGAVETLAREKQALAYYGWKPYLHNPGLNRWLHRVTVPTLVVWGEQDRFVAPTYGRALAARLPKSELKLVGGAGHYPQIEQAEAVAEAITAFAQT